MNGTKARSRRQPPATPTTEPRGRGRPRDPLLDAQIVAAAARQLEERGYTAMSMESVAAEAGTTVPTVRRRYPSKASLAAAVVDSLRAEPLPARAREPRATALAILENFHRNLRRPHALAVLGTLLAEEDRNPALMERFRKRLVEPRRAILLQTLEDAQRAGELPPRADLEMIVNMLIGSFYARYVSGGAVRGDWPRRALDAVWPVSTG